MPHLNWGSVTSVPTSPFARAWPPALPARNKIVRPVCLATRAASERPNPSGLLVRVPCRQGSGTPFPKRSTLSCFLGRVCRRSPGRAADQSLRAGPCLWVHAVKVLCALNGFVCPRNRSRFGGCALNGFERSNPFKAHGGKMGRMCGHTNPAKLHMRPRPTAEGRLADSLGAPNPQAQPQAQAQAQAQAQVRARAHMSADTSARHHARGQMPAYLSAHALARGQAQAWRPVGHASGCISGPQ